MTIPELWTQSPEASAALLIAIVAGLWALLQLRPVARERRRETYDAMTSHYAQLRSVRDAAVPTFPPLVLIAQDELERAAEANLANRELEIGRHHSARIVAEIRDWKRFGVAFTSADEILRSEAKFRCLLRSLEIISNWRRGKEVELCGKTYSIGVLNAAENLVHDLNAFLFHYENGNYPSRQTLGLLHRSLAIASKAMEPVVWSRSLQARWGRRVLRIGISAQHFNDVTEQHCVSSIVWRADGDTDILVHPRLKRLVLGSSVLTDSQSRPRLLPAVRLQLRSWCWYLVGLISPPPRVAFVSYGGARLATHRKRENELAGLLSVALERFEPGGSSAALDLSWDLKRLRDDQRRIINMERRARGYFAWIWLPRARGNVSGYE